MLGMATPRPLDRRTFLALAAGAAGTVAIPALLGSPAGAGTPRPTLLAGPEYPIGFWWPPPPAETTTDRYAEIARAGFTFVTGGNGVVDMPINAAMLAAADANGLLAIPQDTRMNSLASVPSDERTATVRAVLSDYGAYDSFAGLLLYDEPNTAAFPDLAAASGLIRRLAPRVLPYINLFPTYATTGQLGAASYWDYLQQFLTAVDPSFLSFDHYALLASGGVRGDYFFNWSQIRRASVQAGIPSWVFILSVDMPGIYRSPTAAELLWQVNVSLSYGGKGIQYFTYWTPNDPAFGESLIAKDGTEGPLYGLVQRLNRTYLSPVGRQLLPLVSELVVHANESPLPSGTVGFAPDEFVSAVSGAAVILSRFRHPQPDRTDRLLLVANRSYDAAAQVSLTFGDGVERVFEFAPAGSTYRPVPLSGATTTVALDPGAARLFRLAR